MTDIEMTFWFYSFFRVELTTRHIIGKFLMLKAFEGWVLMDWWKRKTEFRNLGKFFYSFADLQFEIVLFIRWVAFSCEQNDVNYAKRWAWESFKIWKLDIKALKLKFNTKLFQVVFPYNLERIATNFQLNSFLKIQLL